MAATVVAWAPTSATNSGSSNVANWSGTATSLTPDIAGSFSLQANDVLVLVASADGAQTLSITPGWTATITANGLASGSCYVWWKRTTGTETNPTISGATGSICLQAIQIRGAPPSVTRWFDGNLRTGTSTSITPMAQVASAPDTLLIQTFASARNNTVSACSLGSFTYHNTSAGLDTMCGFAWGTQALPGTTGTPTVTQSRSDAWISALFRFDYPIEIGETATPDDTNGYALERAGVKEELLPAETALPTDGYARAYVGSVRGVELPGAQASTTPSEALRGPGARASIGSISESATPQDGIAAGIPRATSTPFIRSLSATTIAAGNTFTVNGDPGWTFDASVTAATGQGATERGSVRASESAVADEAVRDGGAVHTVGPVAESADATDGYARSDSGEQGIAIAESAAAQAGQGGAVAPYSVVASESALPQDAVGDGAAGHARDLSESVTAADGFDGNQRLQTSVPYITSLSSSSIAIGDTFTVNGVPTATALLESTNAAVALACTQVFASTIDEAVAAADGYLPSAQQTRTPTPILTSLSASTITIGDSFIVNGLEAPQNSVGEISLPQDLYRANQAFVNEIAESTAPTDAFRIPSQGIVLPSSLEAWEADLYSADISEGDDALIGAGEYIEWLVDPGAGGIFTFEGTLSSYAGGKIIISVNGIDQPAIYVPSDEEEEEIRRF